MGNEIYAAIKEKVPKLEPIRIPMNQEKAPEEENFDQIVAMLKDTTASSPVIFNCQAGISRTTTAVVCGALVKELQLTRELDRRTGMPCRWENSKLSRSSWLPSLMPRSPRLRLT